jgi:hypothetical protein
LCEDIRHERLRETLTFMDDYSHLTAKQLMLFRQVKDEDEKEKRAELEDVVIDYKLGMMDPGRLAAAFERITRVYKNRYTGKRAAYKKLFKVFEEKVK